MTIIIGTASAAMVRLSKLRFGILYCLVYANHTARACATKVITMAMTFDHQSNGRGNVEKTIWCAKEEVSSSLLGKLVHHVFQN